MGFHSNRSPKLPQSFSKQYYQAFQAVRIPWFDIRASICIAQVSKNAQGALNGTEDLGADPRTRGTDMVEEQHFPATFQVLPASCILPCPGIAATQLVSC